MELNKNNNKEFIKNGYMVRKGHQISNKEDEAKEVFHMAFEAAEKQQKVYNAAKMVEWFGEMGANTQAIANQQAALNAVVDEYNEWRDGLGDVKRIAVAVGIDGMIAQLQNLKDCLEGKWSLED